MVNEFRIGAMLHQHPHHVRFGEARRQPIRRRSHQLRLEIPIVGRAPRRRPCLQRSVRIRAVIELRGHHFFVAPHDCFVQRREAGLFGIGVGSLIEKEFDQIGKTRMRRKRVLKPR